MDEKTIEQDLFMLNPADQSQSRQTYYLKFNIKTMKKNHHTSERAATSPCKMGKGACEQHPSIKLVSIFTSDNLHPAATGKRAYNGIGKFTLEPIKTNNFKLNHHETHQAIQKAKRQN